MFGRISRAPPDATLTAGQVTLAADQVARSVPGVSAETPAGETPAGETPAGEAPVAATPVTVTSSHLADALLVIAETFLAGQVADAENPDVYQVIVHVGAGALPAADPAGGTSQPPAATSADVPAETPPAPGHPADPARCHVEDGPAISVSTAQMITCTAALSWLLHDRDGSVLDAGRRRRRPGAALRRAARDRDHCRCRFPGCESRRVDLHHIQHWINGGRTSLKNLISLCPYHHMLIHQRGYLIASGPADAFTFHRPDGTLLPASPAPPDLDGTINDCHDAAITPATIIPAWYGERLDLDYAIHACFANAAYHARHRDQANQANQQDEQSAAPAPAPEQEPWRPIATEIDVIAGIQQLCQKYALN